MFLVRKIIEVLCAANVMSAIMMHDAHRVLSGFNAGVAVLLFFIRMRES